jgi:hypothetical protein
MMVASPPVVTVRSKSFEHMRRRIHAFHMRRDACVHGEFKVFGGEARAGQDSRFHNRREKLRLIYNFRMLLPQ